MEKIKTRYAALQLPFFSLLNIYLSIGYMPLIAKSQLGGSRTGRRR